MWCKDHSGRKMNQGYHQASNLGKSLTLSGYHLLILSRQKNEFGGGGGRRTGQGKA